MMSVNTSALEFRGCSQYSNSTEYGSEIEIPKGDYSVYVKLGKRGMVAEASVSGFSQKECKQISSSKVTSEKWHRIGSWTSLGTKDSFLLASESLGALPDANRPTLLFVPSQSPPCEPDIECSLSYNGVKGVVKPVSTILSENALNIVRVVDPSTDILKNVNYFVDNQYVYSTNGFEKFDMRYVPGGKHKLSRVASFESGQDIDFSETVDQSYTDGLNSFMFTAFKQNFRFMIVFIVFITMAILSHAVLWLIRYWHKKHLWMQNHGFEAAKIEPEEKIIGIGDPSVLLSKPHIIKEDGFLFKTLNTIGFISLVLAVSWTLTNIVDSYLISVAKVNGNSMQNTFSDNQKLLVNRLGVSLEKVRKGKFIPPRGEIVFVKNSSSDSKELKKSSYLVKRVLGLPGDRIEVRKGEITIYNLEFPNGFKPDNDSSWVKNIIVDNSENLDIVLDNDELFVVGDNRPQSIDSRFNGAVRSKDIVGTKL